MTEPARSSYDVVIIGAGIAGTSLAHFLSERGVSDVLVVEQEQQAGCHATGRSAATLVTYDENDVLRALKLLGAAFLHAPPPGFAARPLLDPVGTLLLLREPGWSALLRRMPALQAEGIEIGLVAASERSELLGGVLEPAEIDGGALLSGDGFLDVHELLSSYIRHARRRRVELLFGTRVTGLLVAAGRCRGVQTEHGPIEARRVVNAAGAWVERIAAGAGAVSIPFSPRRRCLVVYPSPRGIELRGWPLVMSDVHQLYFRRESGGVLFCPMDEAPSEPCDAAPDELAIAEGLERLRALAPRLFPGTIGRRWAGLRTFAPDRIPVVGDDPRLPGLFWLAGQGGCGIETSPALGQIAADLLVAGRTERFDAARLAPGRFA